MTFIRNALMAAVVAAAVPAVAADAPVQTDGQLTGKQEVAYTCEVGAERKPVKLTAMYGFQGDEVTVAQVKINGQTSPGMWRVPDLLLNRFVSTDEAAMETMWTTWPATAAEVAKVDGGKLSYAEQRGGVQTIIVENCKLDQNETARLNR